MAPPEVPKSLAILPELEVVATGELMPADRMLLVTFATTVREDVWQLDRDRVLEALAAGRTLAE